MWRYQLFWPADLGKGGDISKMMMTVFRQNPEMEPVYENISCSNFATVQAKKCQPEHSNRFILFTFRLPEFVKKYFLMIYMDIYIGKTLKICTSKY